MTNIGTMSATRRMMEDEFSWDLLRDLRGSTRAMRAAGAKWLTPDSEERRDPKRFAERLQRSTLWPAYDDAIDNLASMPFQRPIQVGELPDPLARIESNADRQGTSLTRFAKSLLEDLADRGMALLLVDNVPAEVQDGDQVRRMNLAEAEAMDARPYFVRIAPDNLIGGKHEVRNGREVITELRVREWTTKTDANNNEIAIERVRRWTETGFDVWEREEPSAALMLETVNGGERLFRLVQPMKPHGFAGIPLVTIYAKKLAPLTAKPPLLGLAWENVGHWNSSSQQAWVLHYARAPLLVITNVSHATAEAPPKLGAGAALVDSGDAKVFYVEPAGTSIQAGERDIAARELRMRAMSMAPAIDRVAGPDTATGEVRAEKKQQTVLQSWVEALEWGLYDAYGLAAQWLGEALPEDFDVAIFRDMAVIGGGAPEIAILQTDVRENRITHTTYLTECQKRGWYPDLDVEAEVELTATDPEPDPSTPAPDDAPVDAPGAQGDDPEDDDAA